MGQTFAVVPFDDLNDVQFRPGDAFEPARFAAALGGKQLFDRFGISSESMLCYGGANHSPAKEDGMFKNIQHSRSPDLYEAGCLFVMLVLLVAGCASQGETILVDDFESGDLSAWVLDVSGQGGWFVYDDGSIPPDPVQSDTNYPFHVPDPPQGEYAAITDMANLGTRILHKDLELDRPYMLHLTAFYVTEPNFEFASPDTLAYDVLENNHQFRIDLVDPTAQVDSLEEGDVLANIFRTSPGDPAALEPTTINLDLSPWEGQTIRLRLAQVDNAGPLRAGVDDIRLELLQ